jgi:predicted nucleotidyltransferase
MLGKFMRQSNVPTAIHWHDRALLDQVAREMRAAEPTARIVLYGSRARGDARPDSDWDLLVLVDGVVTDERFRELRRRLFELEIEADAVLSTNVESKADWDSALFRAMPYRANVERDGIEL